MTRLSRPPAIHLRFPLASLPEAAEGLRAEVRALLERERASGTWEPGRRSWGARNPALSRKLGEGGFIGMTWPKQYGGAERSYLERYVVTEELLAAGAPTGFHWVADRQSGPLLLRFGSESQRRELVPRIARGELSFCIGMSEPDSGSDLASIRTRAVPDGDGWRLSGTKIWTSGADQADYCIVLCRTEEPSENRHAGISQLLVDLKKTDGITVRPVPNLSGERDFNEVVFDSVYVPAQGLLGEPGNGWQQVTSELAYERAGPERFLSNLHVLRALIEELGERTQEETSPASIAALGAIVTRLWTLRQAALSVAGVLETGAQPNVESALTKDLGTQLQQALPELVREIGNHERLDDLDFRSLVEHAVMVAPAYTIQGGTTEILRGIVARGLGLR